MQNDEFIFIYVVVENIWIAILNFLTCSSLSTAITSIFFRNMLPMKIYHVTRFYLTTLYVIKPYLNIVINFQNKNILHSSRTITSECECLRLQCNCYTDILESSALHLSEWYHNEL